MIRMTKNKKNKKKRQNLIWYVMYKILYMFKFLIENNTYIHINKTPFEYIYIYIHTKIK